jgi:pilus assembly protein CpaF
MRDPEVSDILVNTSRQVYVERMGKLEATPVIFRDDAHLLQIIDRIVSRIGRRIDESSPMVDARLSDGSRVNAIIPPLALDGPILSIRRFGRTPLMVDDLIRIGSMTAEMADLLRAMVRARLNLLVSGGTGSGKTTLLNCLSAFIPDQERIVTVETRPSSSSSNRTSCARDAAAEHRRPRRGHAARAREEQPPHASRPIIVGRCAAPSASTCCRP